MAEPILHLPIVPRGTGAADPRVHLRLMGGFLLEHDDAELPTSSGSRRLLAVLGVSGGMTRTAVAGMLWPDSTDDHAQGSLRSCLWRLGGLAGLVETRCELLALAATVEVDVRSFAWCVSRLTDLACMDGPDLEALLADTGELLPGWYDDWVLFERERLRQRRLHALETVAVLLCKHGRYAAAIEAALQAIRLEPLRERAHRILITVHLRERNLGEALRHYRSFRRLLHDELGIEPSPRIGNLITARFPDAGRLM